MPTCSRCLEKKPLDAFSDAQLVSGKRKCLQCSNPRLHERKVAEGLAGRPLADLGRQRPRAAPPPADATLACTGCGRHFPLRSFSARQRSPQGKGRCTACAASAYAANTAEQQAAAKRRRLEEAATPATAPPLAGGARGGRADSCSDDERYEESLLSCVEAFRPAPAAAPAPLDASNVGHRLLQRLGWSPGRRNFALMPSASSQRDCSSAGPGPNVAVCITGSVRSFGQRRIHGGILRHLVQAFVGGYP
ncbi:hypothetical protein EMIHUDRAFT_461394 [Emiliania huxleyi CCMP1516]|uniref:Stc1 domain-containing protein n=2 Tax=Emiliania huxleyi TaxID=2903 RepID=A0A0D3J441_EMIH1|nr:hypothetical protein EMIHUDRAFT_461394 [Emiliania huxleyi CCMP1516]EOD18276.1 hypothetical protein EMIHUDRAFT_461394 [Emiliania huxleyi CCMP1516]|eukprot:XP_005770705.1 hypothetical protein EMIHUDRAFT_461394 [Emiliania huxleyi CCMP1516]